MQPVKATSALLLCSLTCGFPLCAATDQVIFDDALQNGWQNWSWAAVDLNQVATVHGGTKAIAVTVDAWEGLYLAHDAMDSTGFTNLAFWIHGGSGGGQRLQVQAILGTAAQSAWSIPTLPANTWQRISVPLATLSAANALDFTGFWIQDRSGTTQPTFFVDDVVLLAGASGPPPTNTVVSIVVDTQRNRHPIDERIYGVAFASSASALTNLNCPLHRSGGNSETRYNWELNAHNHGFDWYFESLADSPATAGAEGDEFVATSRAGGAEPMLTIPMIGWAPKLGPNRGRLASFSIAKYGAQTDSDAQWFPDAGNGIRASDGTEITSNDPNDANQPVDVHFQSNWVQHLVMRWGPSTNGGVRYYFLDNEHSLWHLTHRDVHPVGATLEEIRDQMIDHATMIKTLDPDALVLGPEEWGWSGYFYSGYDQQYGSQHGWGNYPDRAAHGGQDYVPWLLGELRQRSTAAGRRLLDVFTLHCYPQGGEFGSDVSSSMQLRRNRSTRALWDPAYVDETWISTPVRLIPRMKSWVAADYPGTRIGITEYNWGAENHLNGATAQADLLGLFGREGLDLATRWTTPGSTTPTFKAIQMYRNYDGRRSTFGDSSVYAGGPNPDQLAVFAAERSSDGALTVMAINKVLSGSTPAVFTLTNFTGTGAAQVWQLNASNVIARLPDTAFEGAPLSNTLPAQSITLFILGPAETPPPAPTLHAQVLLHRGEVRGHLLRGLRPMRGALPREPGHQRSHRRFQRARSLRCRTPTSPTPCASRTSPSRTTRATSRPSSSPSRRTMTGRPSPTCRGSSRRYPCSATGSHPSASPPPPRRKATSSSR